MRPPSQRVAANRRRLILWLPLTTVGAILFALGLRSEDLQLPAIGLVLVMAGFPGLVMDTGREITTYYYWPEDLEKETTP